MKTNVTNLLTKLTYYKKDANLEILAKKKQARRM